MAVLIKKTIALFMVSVFFLPEAFPSDKFRCKAPSTTVPDSAKSLRDELNRRWYDSKLPDFLEKRRNEEAVFAGPELPAEEYRGILQSDGAKPAGKISELIDARKYSSLQHQMQAKWLAAVLREGRLLPRSGSYWNNSEGDSLPGVYLELHRHDAPKPFAWGDVELRFDFSLLDRGDYLINPFWDYGTYTPLSASPAASPGRTAYYIQHYLLQKDENEIVFTNPVPLEKLLIIVVPAGRRKQILQVLEKENIRCPRAGGWAAMIEERN
ncbi:MAG: hypothetical protein WC421_04085 [Elusimicrobiales bacterium]